MEVTNEEDSSEISPFNNNRKGVKRKSEFQTVYCSVCKISLNSSSQATAHYSGKSHQSKVRSQSSVVTAQTPSIAKVSVCPPQIKSLKCEMCKRSFNSDSQLKAHMSGKTHQLLAKSKLESSGVLSLTEDASLALPTEDTASLALPTEDTALVAQCSTVAVIEPKGSHTSFGSNLTKVFHCAKCDITLNSQKQMEQHNKGLRHKIIIGKAKPPAVAGEKWENVRYMKIANAVMGMNKDTVIGSGGGMNLRQFYCEKCDLTVNSQMQLDQHLLSQKHTMNIHGKKRQGGIAAGRGAGRSAGQSYQYKSRNVHYEAKRKVIKPYLPALSMNFVRSSEPILEHGYYAQSQNFHFMEQFGHEGVSQNWNSNFINYDMPPQNLALF